MTSKKPGAAGTLFEIEGDRLLARTEAHSSRFIKITVVAPPVTSKRPRPAVRIGFVLAFGFHKAPTCKEPWHRTPQFNHSNGLLQVRAGSLIRPCASAVLKPVFVSQ